MHNTWTFRDAVHILYDLLPNKSTTANQKQWSLIITGIFRPPRCYTVTYKPQATWEHVNTMPRATGLAD